MTDGYFAEVEIALGAVAPTPVRAKTVERALLGQEANQERIKEAATKVAKDISPISDGRSSAKYRSYVTPILVSRIDRRSDWRGWD